MNFEESIKRIERYINSDSNMPIIVDVPNVKSRTTLLNHFGVGDNEIVSAEKFAKKDSLPVMSEMKDWLSKSSAVVFLTGLTPFLFLQGELELTQELKSLLELHTEGKLIIISFGCGGVLSKFDHRLIESVRIILVDGQFAKLPTLCFISPSLPEPEINIIKGINSLPKILTLEEVEFNIITDKRKADFPESKFDIKDYKTSFQYLSGRYPEFGNIVEDAVSESDWDALLADMDDYEDVYTYVSFKFSSTEGLASLISNFGEFDDLKKIAYFLALRIYGAKGNNYLSDVISNSVTYDQFKENCFSLILKNSIQDKNFWAVYENRKTVLSGMQDFSDIIQNFCKQSYDKGKDALCYMTDLNKIEKEQTINLLARDGKEYDKGEVVSILNKTYPDLSKYLSHYRLENNELDEYIEQYKYCKVTNRISDEFKAKVEAQAENRQFNEWLRPRSEFVDSILRRKDKCQLYFIDAMGIEYLGFLQNKCFENKLDFHADVARCELPSITAMNKGFVEEFKQAGYKVSETREMDSLKHEGQNSYNYENNKIPIHIVEELNILNELVEQLKTAEAGVVTYVISDHGATRLAVINETDARWEVKEKGIHSGRCCPKSDIGEKPDIAIEENDFWCIANYDRFKGGRKAPVEVHGGATIEEVAVPIISVKKREGSIRCCLLSNDPIQISFKKKAVLKIYVSVESDEVFVEVGESRYSANKTDVPYHYFVEMPDITYAGTYNMNIYVKDALVCRGLAFNVKKEGVSENKFF